MTKTRKPPEAPRLYIAEWMEVEPGLDGVRLAKRMGTTSSSISKKLAEPWRINQKWLQRFADGLGLDDPTLLYRRPSAALLEDPLVNLTETQREEVENYGDYALDDTNRCG